ncbi:hypothetical protein [Streptomyces sp. NPDC003077]|uniref:TolB family protein n=1 Tax=Streptomyces sp. NPDC003077 TaxID=3154443 RepID=UPI0033B2394B
MNGGSARRWRVCGAGGLAVAMVLAGVAAPAKAAAPRQDGIVQLDLGLDGAQPNGWSRVSQVSADGRYALFISSASNLVPGDVNGDYDAFVRDLRTGRIEQVSVADNGEQVGAGEAAISAGGRYVAFSSVVAPGGPGSPDSSSWKIFVRDRWTGHTEQITTGAGDFESPAISGNGRYVAYTSDQRHIHVTDRWKKTTRLVTAAPDGSPADQRSDEPVISADGTTVGFRSRATNLLPRAQAATVAASRSAPPRHPFHFYTWNARTGRIQGASIDPAGALRETLLHATLSPNGRYALFRTRERNGADSDATHDELYVRDLWRGRTTKAARPLPGTQTVSDIYGGTMTADNRWVFFASGADNLAPGDTNRDPDIFRRDLWTGRTTRIDMTENDPVLTWSPDSLTTDSRGTVAIFDKVGKVYARRLPRS